MNTRAQKNKLISRRGAQVYRFESSDVTPGRKHFLATSDKLREKLKGWSLCMRISLQGRTERWSLGMIVYVWYNWVFHLIASIIGLDCLPCIFQARALCMGVWARPGRSTMGFRHPYCVHTYMLNSISLKVDRLARFNPLASLNAIGQLRNVVMWSCRMHS